MPPQNDVQPSLDLLDELGLPEHASTGDVLAYVADMARGLKRILEALGADELLASKASGGLEEPLGELEASVAGTRAAIAEVQCQYGPGHISVYTLENDLGGLTRSTPLAYVTSTVLPADEPGGDPYVLFNFEMGKMRRGERACAPSMFRALREAIHARKAEALVAGPDGVVWVDSGIKVRTVLRALSSVMGKVLRAFVIQQEWSPIRQPRAMTLGDLLAFGIDKNTDDFSVEAAIEEVNRQLASGYVDEDGNSIGDRAITSAQAEQLMKFLKQFGVLTPGGDLVSRFASLPEKL